jgi:hypothetical protein
MAEDSYISMVSIQRDAILSIRVDCISPTRLVSKIISSLQDLRRKLFMNLLLLPYLLLPLPSESSSTAMQMEFKTNDNDFDGLNIN